MTNAQPHGEPAAHGGAAGVHRPRLVIAGVGSGVGKTTLTIGLMAAFQACGLVVQGFKCGPDYIDPTYHTAITGRPSRNLDVWMTSPAAVREIFLRASAGADLSVIEGVMGLFDGRRATDDEGSTAHIARLLSAPVLLVLNAGSMARTAAAVVTGCQAMAEGFAIAGVIANQVGSAGHAHLIREAVEGVCGVPVVGYLARDATLDIPERHLGLVPAVERGKLTPLFARLAERVAETVDLDAVLALARSAPPLPSEPPRLFLPAARPSGTPRARIAVARDAAFNFYYPENLELLERCGAELVFFRPTCGERLPEDVDGLYIGGGFPEVYAAELAKNHALKADIRRAAAAGMPVFAECGGYLYLCRSVTTTDGRTHEMVGLIPARARMQERLAALGYREVCAVRDTPLLAAGETARGHAFHYSVLEPEPDVVDTWPHAYRVRSRFGARTEGYANGSVLAGYTHLHFVSHPPIAERWVTACEAFRCRRRQAGR